MFNPNPKNITPKKEREPLKKKSSFKNSIPDLIKQATIVFNAWIRKRDEGKPCISCGKYVPLEAGHYYNAKQFPELRLDEINVNGQCIPCNRMEEGNVKGYFDGLIMKYGIDEIKELQTIISKYRQIPFKWEREQLKKIIEQYSK